MTLAKQMKVIFNGFQSGVNYKLDDDLISIIQRLRDYSDKHNITLYIEN